MLREHAVRYITPKPKSSERHAHAYSLYVYILNHPVSNL